MTLNLEIVFLNLTGDQFDLSFLENVREVNGYVLIHGNHVTKIRLSRLRVIRGMTLYREQAQEPSRFSLYVTENALPRHDSIGLQELQMTSLVGRCFKVTHTRTHAHTLSDVDTRNQMLLETQSLS